MPMFKFTSRGSFKNAEKYLEHLADSTDSLNLDRYGKLGVQALSRVTPVDTGFTAESWDYEIEKNDDSVRIIWVNNNVNDRVNVAVILQYGHGTRNGGYVQGTDYINPALRPVFQEIADEAWKEITKT